MYDVVKMKEQLKAIKAEAQELLDKNKIADAQSKITEGKVLKAKIEFADKLNEANNKIADLTKKLEAAEKERDSAVGKFNDLTDTVTKLNAKVKEMESIVNKYYEEQYEKKLKEALNYYRNMFASVNGLDKFEEKEVQELIKKTVEIKNNKPTKEAEKAKFTLNEMIVDLLETKESEDVTIDIVNETCIETKDLNPAIDKFEQIYGFKKE